MDSDTVPIWFTFSSSALHVFSAMARATRTCTRTQTNVAIVRKIRQGRWRGMTNYGTTKSIVATSSASLTHGVGHQQVVPHDLNGLAHVVSQLGVGGPVREKRIV